MKPAKVKAIFIGYDDSTFLPGREYNLNIFQLPGAEIKIWPDKENQGAKITVIKTYETIIDFFKEWSHIHVQNQLALCIGK